MRCASSSLPSFFENFLNFIDSDFKSSVDEMDKNFLGRRSETDEESFLNI
jgi:hypothetical protein